MTSPGDKQTPNIGQANEDISPNGQLSNPILERARQRILSRRESDIGLAAVASSQLDVGLDRLGPIRKPLNQSNSIPNASSSIDFKTDEETSNSRYRRRRLSAREGYISPLSAITNSGSPTALGKSIPPPPQKKAPRPLLKRNAIAGTPLPEVVEKENQLASQQNTTSSQKLTGVILQDQELGKAFKKSENVSPLELEDIINAAEKLELQQLDNFLELHKWIPMWNKISLEGGQKIYFPENVNLRQMKEMLFQGVKPKHLEQEGIYVEEQADMSNWNLNKMERRLVATLDPSNKRWLREDYRMSTDMVPLTSVMLRGNREIPQVYVSEDEENQMQPKVDAIYNPADLELNKAFKNSSFRRVMDSPDGTYELMMYLDNLCITDHPLTTNEFRMAKELEKLVSNWTQRRKSKLVDFLSIKLKSLKEEYDTLTRSQIALSAEPSVLEHIPPKPVNTSFYSKHQDRLDARRNRLHIEEQERKRALLKEVHSTRLLRDAETKTDRLLEYQILKIWSDIKKERKTTGFSSTKINLAVKVKQTSQENDRLALESEISEELKEVYDLYKYEYAHRQRLYEKKMEVWQKRHEECELLREQRKKEFQEKLNTGLHKFVGKAKELSIDDTLQIEENTPKDNEDIESLQKKKPKKIKVQAIQWLDDVYEDPMPVEPKEKIYKEEQLRKEISKRINGAHRPVGAPIITFVATNDSPVTETAQCPRAEQLRRRELEATYIYVKIFYNDKEVTKTSPRPLDFIDMSIHFKKEEDAQKPEGITASPNSGLLLALKVAEVPESIRIEVYETGLLGDLIVGDLYVPVPRPGETMIAVDRETMFVEFSGRPFNRNVSSSRKTDLMLLDGDDWYSGAISLFCAWGVDETGVSLGPKRLYLTSFAV